MITSEKLTHPAVRDFVTALNTQDRVTFATTVTDGFTCTYRWSRLAPTCSWPPAPPSCSTTRTRTA
ncbi:hypothetical protein [Streptomyces sp. NPDC094049]|uniref:hypothetical protein n=1 Tax=Streptomyces sp. NPDC094049 TaxID=3154987 RepID=UPI00332A3A5D